MKHSVLKMMWIGVAVGVASLSAMAQTTITLTSSGSDLITFSGTGNGTVTATLGNCTGSQCTLSGGSEGSVGGSSSSGYTLQFAGAMPLTDNGGGSYSASAAGLSGSSLTLTGNGGATVFSGTLSALSFTDAANDMVNIQATVNGTGSSNGTTITLMAGVQLDGANLADVASSKYPTAVSGGIVPEPTTLLLFGSGLIGLGGLIRRRLGVETAEGV